MHFDTTTLVMYTLPPPLTTAFTPNDSTVSADVAVNSTGSDSSHTLLGVLLSAIVSITDRPLLTVSVGFLFWPRTL